MANLKDKNIQISVNPYSIFIVIGVVILLYMLWTLKTVIFMLFISFIIASTLKPLVGKFEKKFKMPPAMSISLIFAGVIMLFSALSYLVVSNLTTELTSVNLKEMTYQLALKFDEIAPGDQSSIAENILIEKDTQVEEKELEIKFYSQGGEIVAYVPQKEASSVLDFSSIFAGTNIFIQWFSGTFGMLIAAFTVFVVAFYMLQRKGDVYDGLLSFLSQERRKKIRKYIHKVESNLGAWLTAQFVLMVIIGMITYIGLIIPSFIVDPAYYSIGKLAVTIAVLAGVLEIVPNLGPTITLFIAVLISIATGGDNFAGQSIYVILFFIFIQQIEGVLIVPKIIKHAVGIDPIITILSVIAATIVFGPIGAVLVIPLIATLQIVLEFVMDEREEQLQSEIQ